MRINTSQVSMDASVKHKDVTEKTGQINNSTRKGGPEFQLRLPGMTGFTREKVEGNRQSQELCSTSSVRCPEGEKVYQTTADQAIEKMVSEVSGQRVRLRKIPEVNNGETLHLSEPLNPLRQQLAFSFVSQTSHYEHEQLSVHSSGSVSLADGREIDFSLELNMERESLITENFAWPSAGRVLMDPLTLNFECDLRSLVNKTFQFDMNCDGSLDEFNSLAPGTGFLALDLNDNNQINNGRELFGPTTGHGFTELAAHDFDLNGWIDENDPIFSKLRIWKPETTGESSLLTMTEAGVGAICLTHDTNSFQLKDRDNRLMGEVAATGLFLTENGEVRPMQEIKLAVQEKVTQNEVIFATQRELEPRLFLKQIIAKRQEEVHALARLRLSRQEEKKNNLLEILFPDWEKEKDFPSVDYRKRDRLLS